MPPSGHQTPAARSLGRDLCPDHALGALGKPLKMLRNLEEEQAARRVPCLKRVQFCNLGLLAQIIRSSGS